MFFSLWPKCCVIVSASGTHSVCVCTSNQKLINDAFTSTINKCINRLNELNLEDDNKCPDVAKPSHWLHKIDANDFLWCG